jgi:hypothetical protein
LPLIFRLSFQRFPWGGRYSLIAFNNEELVANDIRMLVPRNEGGGAVHAICMEKCVRSKAWTLETSSETWGEIVEHIDEFWREKNANGLRGFPVAWSLDTWEQPLTTWRYVISS